MNDLRSLRSLYTQVLQDFLTQIDLNEAKFSQEREFFLKQSLKDQEIQQQLQKKISDLESRLHDEKSYAYELFIQGEVQKSCARAIVKYEQVVNQ